jgi:hypothetical protein
LLGLESVWLIVVPDPADAPEILPVMAPIVHANVDGALAASVMFGLVALQIDTVDGLVTTGVGFTVTTIEYGARLTQAPDVDVGVTRYSTEPAVELLGLFSTWLIELPDAADAPVIPPFIVPIVHEKLAGVVDVSAMFGLVALQIVAVAEFVTTGLGFTVTVMVNGVAGEQFPVTDVGVIIYCTDPAVALLGLVNTWLILLPAPAVAPVMPPVMVPIVQEKLLAVVEVSVMFGLVPLQMAAVEGLVIAGVGFTVIVIE